MCTMGRLPAGPEHPAIRMASYEFFGAAILHLRGERAAPVTQLTFVPNRIDVLGSIRFEYLSRPKRLS